jgi:hypothetical protein
MRRRHTIPIRPLAPEPYVLGTSEGTKPRPYGTMSNKKIFLCGFSLTDRKRQDTISLFYDSRIADAGDPANIV